METNVQKWGNSIGLRIPAQITKEMGLGVGSKVEMFLEGKTLTIRPKTETLELLLAKITKENCHHEFLESDDHVGNEIW
jgi:antitoxin MazE